MNMTYPVYSGDIIHLNVGGTKFSTSCQTLTWVPDSFFTDLLSGRISSLRDESGAIFLDRDPIVFNVILNYLRTKNVDLSVDTQILQLEAEHYRITPLIEYLVQLNNQSSETSTMKADNPIMKEDIIPVLKGIEDLDKKMEDLDKKMEDLDKKMEEVTQLKALIYVANVAKLVTTKIEKYQNKKQWRSKFHLNTKDEIDDFQKQFNEFKKIDSKLRKPRNNECHIIMSLKDVNDSILEHNMNCLKNDLSDDEKRVFGMVSKASEDARRDRYEENVARHNSSSVTTDEEKPVTPTDVQDVEF